MRTIQIDENNDIMLAQNTAGERQFSDISVLDDNGNEDMPATRQTVLKAMQLWLGEWGLDTNRGVDWLGVFSGNYPQGIIHVLIRRAVSRLIFVREIVEISILPLQNRRLDVRMIIILTNNQRIEI